MTGPELKEALTELGMTQYEAAQKLGVRAETVNRWCNGRGKKQNIPGPAHAVITRWREEHREKHANG
jgi:transcriptional regulator with XRE-family HTH domain